MNVLRRVLNLQTCHFLPHKNNPHEDMAHLQKGLSAFRHAMLRRS